MTKIEQAIIFAKYGNCVTDGHRITCYECQFSKECKKRLDKTRSSNLKEMNIKKDAEYFLRQQKLQRIFK